MKKKTVVLLLATVMGTLAFTGCQSAITDVILRENQETTLETQESQTVSETVEAQEQLESQIQMETQSETGTDADEADTGTATGTETETESFQDANVSDIASLTPGEIEARKEQQAKFAEARETLYGLANSNDKTVKINQMDRQILANNAYDFSDKNIVFIGDSITEGVTGNIADDGTLVSYPDYVESYLHFNKYLNHGKGGRMFTDFGGEEYSLALDFGQVTNVDSDIIVVFAGVNDYLSTPESKRFGDVNDKQSTAGYCGTVRYFMNELQQYYGDNDIFFVTMYNIDKTVTCSYSDITTQPTLEDYIEVQRKLCKEYGFNIIDLYDIGFMDCTDKETANHYLNDAVHPNDSGNIVIGEHIAAELSLYFSQK